MNWYSTIQSARLAGFRMSVAHPDHAYLRASAPTGSANTILPIAGLIRYCDTDSSETEGVTDALSSALDYVEGAGDRLLYVRLREVTWALPSFPGDRIAIDLGVAPVRSVAVRYSESGGAAVVLPPASYTLEDGILAPVDAWPEVSKGGSVEIVMQCGWGAACPGDVRQALRLITYCFFGGRTAEIPPGVNSILNRYRRGLTAA